MTMLGRPRPRGNLPFAPEDVLTLHRCAIGVDTSVDNAAGYDRSLIHEHETAKIWDTIMVVQHHRRARMNGHSTNLVSRQFYCRATGAFEGGRIHYFLN